MPTTMTPSQLLAAVLRQHADLRDRIWRCEQLADDLDAGGPDPSQLLHEVNALRIAFDEHNQFEERMLRPVLLDIGWLDAVKVSRMVDDHVEEHRAIRRELAGAASGLRGILASLRDHLDGEERYFLARNVLRDDLAG